MVSRAKTAICDPGRVGRTEELVPELSVARILHEFDSRFEARNPGQIKLSKWQLLVAVGWWTFEILFDIVSFRFAKNAPYPLKIKN